MKNERLAGLQSAAGSTPWVLDAKSALARAAGARREPEPLFQMRRLNDLLILKVRLRRDEQAMLRRSDGRLATKIIAPCDTADRRAGRRAVLVGQRGWLGALDPGGELADSPRDRRLLLVLDRAPTFHPLILRAILRREGFDVDPAYVPVAADEDTAFGELVVSELCPLARILLGAGESTEVVRAHAAALGSDHLPADLFLDLAHSWELDGPELVRIMTDWKGVLFGKWKARTIAQGVSQALQELSAQARPLGGGLTAGARLEALKRSTRAALLHVAAVIGDYDRQAYAAKTAWRLEAYSGMALGMASAHEKVAATLGGLEHATAYVRSRLDADPLRSSQAEGVDDMISEFEEVMRTDAHRAFRAG